MIGQATLVRSRRASHRAVLPLFDQGCRRVYSEFRLSSPMMFVAGVAVGLILGWVFEGVISILFRAAFVIMLVVIAYVLFRFWQNQKSEPDPFDDIPDAAWRDLNNRSRK